MLDCEGMSEIGYRRVSRDNLLSITLKLSRKTVIRVNSPKEPYLGSSPISLLGFEGSPRSPKLDVTGLLELRPGDKIRFPSS